MRAIVTGANGFVGSTLIKKLIENNIEVFAIDVSFSINHLPKSTLIHVIESTISDTQEISDTLQGQEYDIFYHFAWRGVNGGEKTDYNIQIENIKLALRCAEIAKKLGCKKFLCSGTVAERAVESLPFLLRTSGGMMYGVAKHTCHLMLEMFCKNIGLDFVWMQFSNIYGPTNKTGNLISYTINQLQSNQPASFGPANQPYDFVYIDDLIEAVYRLGISKTNNNTYFIGSGTPKVLSEYLFTIGKMMNKENLIRVGERSDDGIKYSFDMFDISDLEQSIGKYVTGSFEELIKYTISNY